MRKMVSWRSDSSIGLHPPGIGEPDYYVILKTN